MKSQQRGWAATLTTLCLGAVLVLSACANAEPPRAEPAPVAPESLLPNHLVVRDDLLNEGHSGEIDAMEFAAMEWLNSVQMEYAQDPNFGSPEISRDRATVTLRWFGEQNDKLTRLIGAAPDGLTVVVQPAAFQPGDLNALAQQAALTDGLVPGARVTMAGGATDASGLTIGILELPAGRTLSELGEAFAEALGRPDVPVTVTVSGEVMPVTG